MYFDDYIDEVVEDEEEEESSDESDASSDNAFGSFHKKIEPERVFVRNIPGGKTHVSPAKQTQTQSQSQETFSDGDEEVKVADGSDVKLQAGIIDYCIVLGKAAIFGI